MMGNKIPRSHYWKKEKKTQVMQQTISQQSSRKKLHEERKEHVKNNADGCFVLWLIATWRLNPNHSLRIVAIFRKAQDILLPISVIVFVLSFDQTEAMRYEFITVFFHPRHSLKPINLKWESNHNCLLPSLRPDKSMKVSMESWSTGVINSQVIHLLVSADFAEIHFKQIFSWKI